MTTNGKAKPRDFDEQILSQLPLEPSGDFCVDVYMSLGFDKNCPQPPGTERLATLRFVTGGTEFSLVAVPDRSLKLLARFIKETVDRYEEQT